MRGDPILFKAIRASGNWAYLQIKAYYPPSLREAILPGKQYEKTHPKEDTGSCP